MTSDPNRALRHLGFGAAAAFLAAGLAAGAPAAAQDEPADGHHQTRIERVVILSDKDHREGEARHRVRILDVDGDHAGCDKTEVNDSGGREKTKIVLCGGGDQASSADRAARLEQALGRIQQSDDLSAEHKARVTAALQDAIERLRNTR
jgi:hypothetical protein